MKKLLLVLMLMGVLTSESKPKYRIEMWMYDGAKLYLPQKKVWYRTNHFPLPFKVWVSGQYPFHNISQAEEIIRNWDKAHQESLWNKKPKYITVE